MADIGGYLGLFLGLSIFGVIDLLQKAILAQRNTTSKSSSEENTLLTSKTKIDDDEVNSSV